MYKVIFELIKEPLDLPVSPLYEYLLLLILNVVAFQVAWNASPGGKSGSDIHWLVRVSTFLIIWAISYTVIFVGKWLLTNWILVVSILIGLITLAGITIILIKSRRNNLNQ